MSRGDYHWQHEPCWYAVRTKGLWTGDRKQTTLWNIAGGGQDSETSHSTQKPVECMRRPMLNNRNPRQTIYDPFLGSGTTLIAAETTGRVCLNRAFLPGPAQLGFCLSPNELHLCGGGRVSSSLSFTICLLPSASRISRLLNPSIPS
jgi:DNA methylase